MTAQANTDGLIRELRKLLPTAAISVIRERSWHSLTFSGTQIGLSATLPREPNECLIAEFSRMLPDHEFDLNSQTVADIAVTEKIIMRDGHRRLMIDALLLDD